ncbi:putative alpha-ketoglutarate-dependent sulfonate dioxygenase [Trichoderma citrinoviride]|uniref:Putative alpha-ketoglutarate-dependent sulfonate dioxygenase n=1 Tax=Trichoderma citrinoviride TaxID=58853 RepID=A0A2T4BJD6_9HYPO|nr:putative alpha-ketoglutarate-dependent sulfonate dioxygenase [Trichoderma citrinoviride]PTB69432.1 putative alpha-ketoglutarate-dependent sulfonate dioxygenase [Trichoderma citrinoviride]
MATLTLTSTISPRVLAYKPPHPELKEFVPARDRAFFADPEKTSLLRWATAVEEVTPLIGTELKGVQLSKLTDQQKDELALLVAERGVVFFRDQDITLDQQHALASYYGIQDRDPNQQDPRHVTIIGRGGNIRGHGNFSSEWHGDHSFELNPPSYTLLRMVKTSPSGGDTIFTSQTGLYDALSPAFQRAIEGLHGVHSSDVSHPLVRTHPVTRLKSLFYNPHFVDRIQELNAQESHHILAFLREHLSNADDLTVRWKWTPGAVAFWDNRIIAHKAVPGHYDTELREGKRTAVHGERPFYDPENSESLSERAARLANEKGTNGNGIVEKTKELVLND